MHYIYTSEYYSSIKRMEYCLLQQHGWTLDIIILSEKVLKMKMLVAHSCPTLCDTMDCSLTDSSVHGILQARILEWVAIAFSRGSSQPKDWTWISCTAGSLFTFWVTREAHTKWSKVKKKRKANTLYGRQQKKHRCKEQTFGLCGRRQGWDNMRE